MAYLTASVGRGGSNRVHDVAVVQTALLHLDLREGNRKLVFWSKPIDGRCSRDLERAIAAFQTHQGQRETAKLEPGGKSLAALRDALRPRLRPLRGLEGTAVAYLGAGSDDDGDYLAGRVAEGMVIPSDLRQCLAKLTTKLQRETRLLVVVELCDADAKGRFLARLMFEEGITWIDPASGRLLPSDQAPPEAVRLVTDCAHAISGLVVTNRANMTLRTPVALKCLAGPRRPFDPARAESLGIDPSSDAFPKRVMGAIFGALDGEPELSDEERGIEVAQLCDALENAFPRQAECFLQLAQFHPDDTLEDPHDVHREKIERLLREGKVGWVNDLKGDFVGAGNWAILVLADSGIPVLDAPGGNVFFEAKKTVSQVPFPMTDFIAHLESNVVEGFVSHMYKDIKGKVTIGIGTNLTDNGGADGAIKMLLGKTLIKTTKDPATPRQIEQEYNTILALNLRTSDDKPAAAKAYRPHTTIILSRAGARELAGDFARRQVANVVRGNNFPDFEKTPATAQMGLMDLLYVSGPDGLVDGFPKFRNAFNRRDWRTASIETFRSEVSSDRNRIVFKLFLDAVSGQKFFILKAINRGEGICIDDIQ